MMTVEGLQCDVVTLIQEKPYTMVYLRHEFRGVTYEARGWALWDGQQKWSNWEGQKIAAKRAKRKIARRLAWEAALEDRMLRLDGAARARAWQAEHLGHIMVEIFQLHRDGGTVRL